MKNRRPAIRMSEEKQLLRRAMLESKAKWKSLTPVEREATKLAKREKRKQAQVDYLADLKDTRLALKHQEYTVMVKEIKKTEPVIVEPEILLIEPMASIYPMISVNKDGKTALCLDYKTTIILKPGADPEKVKARFLTRNDFHDFLPSNAK